MKSERIGVSYLSGQLRPGAVVHRGQQARRPRFGENMAWHGNWKKTKVAGAQRLSQNGAGDYVGGLGLL